MHFDESEVAECIKRSKTHVTEIATKDFFSFIDLTSLNESDTEETISALCKKAISNERHAAAVCVYPQFVKCVKNQLQKTSVKIATVANFPHGTDSLNVTLQSIESSIKNGAQEIDVVFPYQKFLANDRELGKKFIQECKKSCGNTILLKVILETGALVHLKLIAQASHDALQAGADFIKTSTGKIAVGATLEAAAVMLLTINELTPILKRTLGFKASGGIRTSEQISQYVSLAETIIGKNRLNLNTFRIGMGFKVS